MFSTGLVSKNPDALNKMLLFVLLFQVPSNVSKNVPRKMKMKMKMRSDQGAISRVNEYSQFCRFAVLQGWLGVHKGGPRGYMIPLSLDTREPRDYTYTQQAFRALQLK